MAELHIIDQLKKQRKLSLLALQNHQETTISDTRLKKWALESETTLSFFIIYIYFIIIDIHCISRSWDHPVHSTAMT